LTDIGIWGMAHGTMAHKMSYRVFFDHESCIIIAAAGSGVKQLLVL
jgi:hypothetical protein